MLQLLTVLEDILYYFPLFYLLELLHQQTEGCQDDSVLSEPAKEFVLQPGFSDI